MLRKLPAAELWEVRQEERRSSWNLHVGIEEHRLQTLG